MLVGVTIILLLLIMKQSNDTLVKQFYKKKKKSGFLGFVKIHRVNSPTVPGLTYQAETTSS